MLELRLERAEKIQTPGGITDNSIVPGRRLMTDGVTYYSFVDLRPQISAQLPLVIAW